MIYRFDLGKLPLIHQAYSVTRKTVWQISDSLHILILVRSGSCEVEINSEKFVLEKGDMLFIPKNQLYIRRPVGDSMCTMVYVHFSLDGEICSFDTQSAKKEIEKVKSAINNTILSGENPPRFNTAFIFQKTCTKNTEQDIDNLFEQIVIQQTKNLIESHLLASLFLSMILGAATHAALPKILSETTLEKRVPPKLNKAVLFIKSNYKAPITLADLCRHCNVSKQQMIRYFRQELGTTPTAYILLFKMNKAKEFLSKSPHLTVKEIAFELGYENPLYFSRVFRKTCGETPSEYKYRVVNYDRLNP